MAWNSEQISGSVIDADEWNLMVDFIEADAASLTTHAADTTVHITTPFSSNVYAAYKHSANAKNLFKSSSNRWIFASSQNISGGTIKGKTLSLDDKSPTQPTISVSQSGSTGFYGPIKIISYDKGDLGILEGQSNIYNAVHCVPNINTNSFNTQHNYLHLTNSDKSVDFANAVKNTVYIDSDYTSTLTNSKGLYIYTYNTQTTGETTNLYGIDIYNYIVNPNIVQNNYGIKIDDITKGVTSNYAIYTGLGKVRFGDGLTVNSGISSQAISSGRIRSRYISSNNYSGNALYAYSISCHIFKGPGGAGGGGTASAFTDLTDVPSSYAGQTAKLPMVNSTETGLIFVDIVCSYVGGDPEIVFVSGSVVFG